jgi:hypothetical protein
LKLTQIIPAKQGAGVHSMRERYFALGQGWRHPWQRLYLLCKNHVAMQQLGL